MEQRVSLITLGVRDMDRAAAFYDAMGWTRVDSPDGVIAYNMLGNCLGLYPLEKLAEDLGLDPEVLGHGAATLSHNVRTVEEVADLAARAEAAGGKVLRPAGPVFWGGTIAYVADPEGHVWEFAHNPFSPLGPKGEFQWGGAA